MKVLATLFQLVIASARAPLRRVNGCLAAALIACTLSNGAAAQNVPAGYQEYLIVGHEQQIWQVYENIRVNNPLAGFSLQNAMISIISFTTSSENQVVFYDHWEDGFETNVLSPAQSSTLVFGNDDISDGRACDYIATRACTTGAQDDLIFAGENLSLESTAGATTVPPTCGAAGNLGGCVPVNVDGYGTGGDGNDGRNPNDIRFDGGDRVVASGGPISIVHLQEPSAVNTGVYTGNVLGGAIEMLSKQALASATAYTIPVGEDTYAGLGGANSPGEPFKTVDLEIAAFEDATTVQIVSPGAGTINVVLQKGQHYSSNGMIGGGTGMPSGIAAPAITVNEGTKISTNKPISGMIVAGGDGTYASRTFSVLPDLLHGNDYVLTAPGDAGGDRPAHAYIFNPDPVNAISVTITDTSGLTTLNVPANTSVPYGPIPDDSTARITSTRNFWGITAYDSEGTAYDWGHSWLATKYLTSTYTVTRAPTIDDTAAVYASPTIDNTCIRIDFNNDGSYDQISNGLGTLTPFSTAPTCTDGYVVNVLASLLIIDPDDDATGARIVANKPIALAFGLETDTLSGGTANRDLGYAIYPGLDLFIDPVLTIDKTSDISSVVTAGGIVTYTLDIDAHDYGPITAINVTDLLPAGASYVPGSTVITRADLTTVSGGAADPTITTPVSRDQLDWTAVLSANSASSLLANERLKVQYQVSIPAGSPGELINDARADGTLGTLVFSPTDSAKVVRTDVVIVKSVADDGTPEAGDVLSYTVNVTNGSVANRTNVVVTDPIPNDSTFCDNVIDPVNCAPIGNAGPFTGTYVAAQNAVVWTAATLTAGSGPFALSFDTKVNPNAAAATVVSNKASFESTNVPAFESNGVETTLVGPVLSVNKIIIGNPNPVHPGESLTFEITVNNTGSGSATDVLIVDPLSANGTYTAASMQWKLNAGSLQSLTDANDGVEASGADGRLNGSQLEFRLATLGPSEDITFRFKMVVSGASGTSIANQANISSVQTQPQNTPLVQALIDGDAPLNGHLFLDLNNDGVQNAGEPNLPFVDVIVTDEDGGVFTVTSDANGDYTAIVPADNGGATTLNVDESDPDFPSGAFLCTGGGGACTDPLNVTAVSGVPTTVPSTGYQVPPVTVTKTSNVVAPGAVPGQVITYTIKLTNNSGVTQTNIVVNDPLPTGTTYDPQSTQITIPGKIDVMRDNFATLGASGGGDNIGSVNFSGPWVEVGESDGFGAGDIQILSSGGSGRLQLKDDDNGGEGAYRVANLSNYQSAILSFIQRRADIKSGDHVEVSVCNAVTSTCNPLVNAPSSGWSTLTQLAGAANDATYTSRRFAIGAAFISAQTRVRFRTNSGYDKNRQVFIDDVQIAASTAPMIDFVDAVNTQSYAGNNGLTGTFTAPWQEVNESDGAALGDLQAVTDQTNFRLRLQRLNRQLRRTMNLSAYSVAHASYLYRRVSLESGDQASFRVDNGGTPTTFATFNGAASPVTDSDYTFARHDISALVGASTRLSFVANALSNDTSDQVYFDSIEVLATTSEVRDNAGVSATQLTSGVAPTLITGSGGDAISLAPGATATITYRVKVDSPLAGGITQLTNIASFTSTQTTSAQTGSVVNGVVRPAVSVEPNAALSLLSDNGSGPLLSDQFATFFHTVTNTGTHSDSFKLAAFAPTGYPVSLVNAATGVLIATDTNGDGIWDAGATPNTGTLAVGQSATYRLRVTVPAGTAVDTQIRVRLRATSDRSTIVSAQAVDDITVAPSDPEGAGDVLVTPDQSRFASAGETVVYTHSVTNNTGAARAFALTSNSSEGYPQTIYRDTNGDGKYTPGVDTAITSTSTLANGASQRVFVVINVDGGAAPPDIDRTTLVASFYNDNGTPDNTEDDIFFGGSAVDTTTISGVTNPTLGFNLSGGGTRVVNAGDVAVYPGELSNTGTAADTYEFTISASRYADTGPNDDDLLHRTELVLDTNGNGVIDGADLVVAIDSDGDGIWDLIRNGTGTYDPPNTVGPYNADGDATPDFSIAAGVSSPYELRRAVDTAQGPYSDSVTFSATSSNGGIDAVTATTSVQKKTLAAIEVLQAFDTAKGVIVEWRTQSEIGTVGFTLQRQNVRDGEWQNVNKRVLPALLNSDRGGTYRLRDAHVRAEDEVSYRLLEFEATGAIIEHGPYDVTVAAIGPDDDDVGTRDQPLPGFERMAHPLNVLAEQRQVRKVRARHAAKRARLAFNSNLAKLSVRETGLYRIDASRIAAVLGLPLDDVRARIADNRFDVLRQGQAIATLPDGKDALLFYGRAIDSLYTEDNIYLLKAGEGTRMASVKAKHPRAEGIASSAHTAHSEGNKYNLAHYADDPDSDYWMWDFRFEDLLFASNTPSFGVLTPHRDSAGTATVTVRLHGASEALHRAHITLRGATTSEHDTQWQGLTPHTFSFQVPAGALLDGDNRIEVIGLGSGDAAKPSTFFINDFDIVYPRKHRAVDGQLHIDHAGRQTSTLGGFGSDAIRAFDVSDADRPIEIVDASIDEAGGEFVLSLKPKDSGLRQIFAVQNAAIRAPLTMVADTPSTLRATSHRVDWLLITANDMLGEAQRLAQHRQQQGLRTLVVDIEDVYDEFAHGVRDANAIWALLRHAHTSWAVAPRYVVLAGEGSFDYKDYLGNGDSIIPTLLTPTPSGLFASDNLFADVEGNDFVPEMAIGRLPVIDAIELRALITKLIAYEQSSGAWTTSAIFGADARDDGGDFASTSDALIASMAGAAMTIDTLYMETNPGTPGGQTLSVQEARTQLHASLNAGRAFFNFFGHANSGSLGNLYPGLLNPTDLLSVNSTLANGNNLPVVTAFTCLVGQFGFPGADGVGELLLVAPNRGAVAVFSPSGLSLNHLAKRLGEHFYTASVVDGVKIIGEAIRQAQRNYAAEGNDVYLLDIYNLLGDPATVMK